MTDKEHAAIVQVRKMLKARKGAPTDADGPRHSSNPLRVLDGQIDIFGQVHSRRPRHERR